MQDDQKPSTSSGYGGDHRQWSVNDDTPDDDPERSLRRPAPFINGYTPYWGFDGDSLTIRSEIITAYNIGQLVIEFNVGGRCTIQDPPIIFLTPCGYIVQGEVLLDSSCNGPIYLCAYLKGSFHSLQHHTGICREVSECLVFPRRDYYSFKKYFRNGHNRPTSAVNSREEEQMPSQPSIPVSNSLMIVKDHKATLADLTTKGSYGFFSRQADPEFPPVRPNEGHRLLPVLKTRSLNGSPCRKLPRVPSPIRRRSIEKLERQRSPKTDTESDKDIIFKKCRPARRHSAPSDLTQNQSVPEWIFNFNIYEDLAWKGRSDEGPSSSSDCELLTVSFDRLSQSVERTGRAASACPSPSAASTSNCSNCGHSSCECECDGVGTAPRRDFYSVNSIMDRLEWKTYLQNYYCASLLTLYKIKKEYDHVSAGIQKMNRENR